MAGADANQVWDQSWWDAQGYQSQPFKFNRDFANPQLPAGTLQIGRSAPSGTVVGGQYWDHNQGRWVQAPGGTPEFTQMAPGGGAGGAAGGGAGAGGAQSPFGTIKTSITPRSVYTPLQTQMAVNQAVSDSRISPNSVYKRFDRPGVSRSQSTKYRSAPAIAAGFSQGQQQAAGIPLGDEIANQQSLMQGQLAQHQEFTGLAGLLLKQLALQQMAQQSQIGNASSLMALLGSFV